MSNKYMNKGYLRELIIKFQECSDDVSYDWLDKYKAAPRRKLDEDAYAVWLVDREDFKDWRKAQYIKKAERLANETPAETAARRAIFEITKEDLAIAFYKIIDGVIRTSEFNNKNIDDDLKQDMRSDAVITMYLYVNRFDSRRPNPFSYFTEMAKNELRQRKNTQTNWNLRFVSSDCLENMDGDDVNLGNSME